MNKREGYSLSEQLESGDWRIKVRLMLGGVWHVWVMFNADRADRVVLDASCESLHDLLSVCADYFLSATKDRRG